MSASGARTQMVATLGTSCTGLQGPLFRTAAVVRYVVPDGGQTDTRVHGQRRARRTANKSVPGIQRYRLHVAGRIASQDARTHPRRSGTGGDPRRRRRRRRCEGAPRGSGVRRAVAARGRRRRVSATLESIPENLFGVVGRIGYRWKLCAALKAVPDLDRGVDDRR